MESSEDRKAVAEALLGFVEDLSDALGIELNSDQKVGNMSFQDKTQYKAFQVEQKHLESEEHWPEWFRELKSSGVCDIWSAYNDVEEPKQVIVIKPRLPTSDYPWAQLGDWIWLERNGSAAIGSEETFKKHFTPTRDDRALLEAFAEYYDSHQRDSHVISMAGELVDDFLKAREVKK